MGALAMASAAVDHGIVQSQSLDFAFQAQTGSISSGMTLVAVAPIACGVARLLLVAMPKLADGCNSPNLLAVRALNESIISNKQQRISTTPGKKEKLNNESKLQ